MTLRAVVAVVLAGALLAVALPGIDAARSGTSATAVRGELADLEGAMVDLVESEDAVPAGTPGARRTVPVELPARTWTGVGIDHVTIGAAGRRANGTGGVMIWRIDGGPKHVRRVPGIRIGRPGGADGPFVLEKSGVHRVVLSLQDRGGRAVVTVARPKFKFENGTSATHANVPGS